MRDAECIELLRWALPRLRLRWRGFRRVRGQVRKRIERRMRALGLPDAASYRAFLEANPGEWEALDAMCVATVSRFYRDPAVWEFLEREVLPELARAAVGNGRGTLRAWSAGCASGEEPYTLALLWEIGLRSRWQALDLRILATDVERDVLERAERARYAAGSTRNLPAGWRGRGFEAAGSDLCLRPEFRRAVTLRRHDLRAGPPDGPFDVIACRNLVFTYYDLALQRESAAGLHGALVEGGALVLGIHERLPEGVAGYRPWSEPLRVYRRCG